MAAPPPVPPPAIRGFVARWARSPMLTGPMIFAPVPIEKPVRLDTATLHKIFMGVASAGMATQIVLGIVTASKDEGL